jgi:hypothetical protein
MVGAWLEGKAKKQKPFVEGSWGFERSKGHLRKKFQKNKEKKGGDEKWPTNSRASMMSPSWENNNCKVS